MSFIASPWRPLEDARRLRLTAMLACLLALLAPPAATAPAAEPDWLTGRMLVASERLSDSNFSETVIYMLEHDAEGALGLVVNRPLGEMALSVLLERLGDAEAKTAVGTIRVLSGGPVQPEKSFVLHTSDVMLDASKKIEGPFAVTADRSMLQAIGRGEGPEEALLIVGYAGWAPGQLESEFERGSWEHVAGDKDIVFSPDDGEKWRKALETLSIDL